MDIIINNIFQSLASYISQYIPPYTQNIKSKKTILVKRFSFSVQPF
jgi:hypothetical protein